MSIGSHLEGLSPSELRKLEFDIARKHIGHFPWLAVIWAFGNLGLWLALWPLVFTGALPLWAGFIIATVCVSACYLPSHEAQHDIIARRGDKLRWLNQLVGHTSTIPLVLPYSVAKLTHMEHHRHANDPELDPDYSTSAPGPWSALWRGIVNRQPGAKGGFNAYGRLLTNMGTPEAKQALLLALIYRVSFYGILTVLAWSGYAIEAALLWWLPRHLALSYIYFFLSWAPHHPAKKTGRYKDTRSFNSFWGNIGSMGMQYHIIHHLHPRIPLYRTPRAYWEMRPVLEARGCDVGDL